LAQGILGDEDDAQTSNTHIAQRKRAIPHSMMKNDVHFSDSAL